MPWTKELQIDGSYDDGSKDGAERSKLVLGELIRQPFWYSDFAAEGVGASVESNLSASLANPDGTNGHMFVNIPADPLRTGIGLRMWLPFRGRAFGVRWTKQRTSLLPDFSIAVDGQAFGPIHTTLDYQRIAYEGYDTAVLTEGYYVVDDLADGEHTAEIHFAADPFFLKQLDLLGYLVERRAGYTERPRTLYFTGPAFVSNTLGTIYATLHGVTGLGYSDARAVRKLIYHNTDTTSAHLVTIYSANSAVAANEVKKVWLDKGQTVGVTPTFGGDTNEIDEGDRLSWAVLQTWNHVADAANVVNLTAVVGS